MLGKGHTGPITSIINYDDTELQLVAKREGRFLQRPDLCQHHAHWTRGGHMRPPHLMKVAGRAAISQKLFEQRKAAGFPGSEFLPA
jgi:hypothetical protein